MVEKYTHEFLNYLNTKVLLKEPLNLYRPISYILELGGKRIRPALTLMACDILGASSEKALPAALSVEMFHNFSLIHDDIMDEAPLRRGSETVHEKWDLNTAILSGDALLIMASQLLDEYDGDIYKKLNVLFHKTAIEVCEGQQYDFDFENTFSVQVDHYIQMITLKTAVLIAAALQFGAIIAEASENNTSNIYNFGLNLGIAFQLQDDYLDIFSSENFGKQKAGDILANKKTYLVLKFMEVASEADKDVLTKWYSSKVYSKDKIDDVSGLFLKYKIDEFSRTEIDRYTANAITHLEALEISENNKSMLKKFSRDLMLRKI